MNFIIVLILMFSSATFAMSVGDRAVCTEVATDMNGNEAVSTTERWVDSQISESRFQCAFEQTSSYGSFRGEFITDISDGKNSFIAELLKNCELMGGAVGKAQVNGQWLPTCTYIERLNESTDRMLIRRTVYADVPFFVLKMDSTYATSTAQLQCNFP